MLKSKLNLLQGKRYASGVNEQVMGRLEEVTQAMKQKCIVVQS